MGVLARIHDRRSFWTGPVASWTDDKIIKVFGHAGAKTKAGIAITPEMAFTFSAVYDAVNQISSDVAKLPLNLLKRDKDGGSDQHTESKTYKLLKFRPNPEQTTMVFRRTITAHALTCKGGFAEIERDGMGRPARLWLIEPHRIQAFREGDGPLRWKVDEKDILDDRDVIHLQGLGYDGINAYPLVTFARQAIGLALAAESFSASFFGNGLQYGGILTSEQPWDEEEAARAKAILEQMIVGPEAAHQLIALWGGMKLEKTGVEPDKAQMDATRSRSVEEVARFFNMPLHKLKSLDRATNNNIEQQDLEYYKGCLLNWVTLWEQELQAKLIPELEWSQQFFKHNDKAFLRGDAAARTALYSALLDRGVYNADMVLELEDMNPQPNGQGKLYLVNGTMVPKDKVAATADARIEQMTKPAPTPAPPKADGGADQDRAITVLTERLARADALLSESREQAEAATARAQAAELNAATSQAERDALQANAQQHQVLTDRLDLIKTGIETELAQARTQIVAATEAKDAAVRAHETTVAEAKRRLAELTDERDAVGESAQRLHTKLTETEGIVTTVVADLEATRAARDAATALGEQALASVATLTEQFARASADLTAATTRAEAATADAEAARRLAAEADERAHAATTGTAEAQAKADELAAAAARATHEAGEALTAQTDALTRATAAEAAVQSAEQRATEAKAQHEAATAQIASLTVSLASAEAQRETALTEARTAAETLATIREQLTAAEQARDDAEARAGTLREALDVAVESRDTLTSERDTAAEQRAAADKQRETAERLAVTQLEATRSAEAYANELKQRIGTMDQERTAADGAVLAAHRALIADVMRRMVGREIERMRRAQASPAKLRTAIGLFYDDHRDLCASALLPALRVHLVWSGVTDDPARVAEALAKSYVEASQRDLAAVLETDPVEEFGTALDKRLQQWERDRPDAIADQVLTEALARQSRRTS